MVPWHKPLGRKNLITSNLQENFKKTDNQRKKVHTIPQQQVEETQKEAVCNTLMSKSKRNWTIGETLDTSSW